MALERLQTVYVYLIRVYSFLNSMLMCMTYIILRKCYHSLHHTSHFSITIHGPLCKALKVEKKIDKRKKVSDNVVYASKMDESKTPTPMPCRANRSNPAIYECIAQKRSGRKKKM